MNPFPKSAWLPASVAVGVLINGIRLRRRLRALPTLTPAGAEASPNVRVVTAEGVSVAEPVRQAAAEYARAEGLAVLDLIPPDLPVASAMHLAAAVDPKTYRSNRLAMPCSAFQASIATEDVLGRMQTPAVDGLGPIEMAQFALAAKRHAPAGADLAIAPGLSAVPASDDTRRATFDVLGYKVPVVLAPAVLRNVLLATGFALNPGWAAVALAAYWAQPYLVLSGGPIRPRDLHRAALTRPLTEPLSWIGFARGGTRTQEWKQMTDAALADARAGYTRDLEDGIERFFLPPRTDCPWCRSTALSQYLVTPDLAQRKPGTFRLDRCDDCRHIFQNPRLTIAGLDFYYRDSYDGLGQASNEFVLSMAGPTYKARADMVAAVTTPKSWLDVGLGHGHFCNVAQGVWPETTFDGLDMSDNVDEAQRRSWISHGYRGQFCELVPELAGRYDVISMNHYLEHTLDPYAEIDAAAQVLAPGGHLLIEVPDPEWPLARVLGRYWLGWSQPQHLHMFPIENLKTALRERGFTVVAQERGNAHMPLDFGCSVTFGIGRVTPNMSAWSPTTASMPRQLQRAATWAAASPLLAAAGIADVVLYSAIRHRGRSNAYRLLARIDSVAPESLSHPVLRESLPVGG
ncbi:class I SAM-dependent methyltransferase [Antrihabitans sp. YC2-6]|uniref:class I SAM-dependent methyltransferase n=1 Tax=Antrihabitans sp. YC2-6 TaxID=2799498 RepID=UPI0018F3E5F0|nr:class I SAM-dependent methyltransferase [Antrihabitans sp. YC2-6]MBJ8348325.1 class I SAM-dependent methyltransferase [Antrihabitans sp. YC2-6]